MHLLFGIHRSHQPLVVFSYVHIRVKMDLVICIEDPHTDHAGCPLWHPRIAFLSRDTNLENNYRTIECCKVLRMWLPHGFLQGQATSPSLLSRALHCQTDHSGSGRARPSVQVHQHSNEQLHPEPEDVESPGRLMSNTGRKTPQKRTAA